MIPPFITNLGTKTIALIIGGLLLIGLLWFGWHQWTKANQAAAEARVERESGDAATKSGADAVSTLGGAGKRENTIDQTVRENENEIRKASGADTPVDDAVDAAGRRSLCRHASNSRNPDCMQHPATK